MGRILFKFTGFLFLTSLWITSFGNTQDTYDERHFEVVMRMIGHEVLLASKDSTSRVLPVIKENDLYRIQFESEFEFYPDELITIVNRVINETEIATGYILQVEQCDTKEIVYSFETLEVQESDLTPCLGRTQPRACYNLLFTPTEKIASERMVKLISPKPGNESYLQTSSISTIIVTALMILAALFFFLKKGRQEKIADPNLIPLGDYQFDKRNTELRIENQKIELSGKEADLLLLLYGSANKTIEREVILNKVWGDDGDYVGRTLDVFISKLRKKLLADPRLKIVNIRGVGYKLVMDV